jgi:hypothetical protein
LKFNGATTFQLTLSASTPPQARRIELDLQNELDQSSFCPFPSNSEPENPASFHAKGVLKNLSRRLEETTMQSETSLDSLRSTLEVGP